MHPLHDISVPSAIEEFIPVVIEIPQGSKLKYEVDKETGFLMLDRVLHSAMRYPANYGFVPRSHAGDDDPLDVLVLMQEPVVPLTIVNARVIGGLRMRDDKGLDDKIIAVAIKDPQYNHYWELSELPPHWLLEVRQFFQDYKVLERKFSQVEASYGREHALALVRGSLTTYQNMHPAKVSK